MRQLSWRYIALMVGLASAALGWASCHAWVSTGTTADGERLLRVQRSPQFDKEEAVFVNELESMVPSLMTVAGQYWDSDAQTVPEVELPRDTGLAARLKTPPGEGLRVSWLGHSSMLIEIGDKRFLTDPMFSSRASPFESFGPKRFLPPALTIGELPPVDAVLISHDHYDHLDYDSVMSLSALGVPFFMPLGVGAHLEYWGVAPDSIIEMDWWEERDVGGVLVACVPSRHFSGRGALDRNSTLWSGWALVSDSRRVFFSGDTAMSPHFLKIGERYGPFDIAMLESGAYNSAWADSHLGPEQAVDAFIMARGRLMLPIHWGTFSLALHAWTEPAERLMVAAKKRGVHLVIPLVGGSVTPSTSATVQRWWPEVPWADAESVPVTSSRLPAVKLPAALSPSPPL